MITSRWFNNGALLVANGALVEHQYPSSTDQDQRGLQRDQRQRVCPPGSPRMQVFLKGMASMFSWFTSRAVPPQ